jgi:predicted phage tail protein
MSTNQANNVRLPVPPLRTKMTDEQGNLTADWMIFYARLGQMMQKVMLVPQTFAQLPTPTIAPVPGGAGATNTSQTPSQGSLAVVTDSTVNTWGSTIAGGGTHTVLAFCDGTNWTVAGI